MSYTHTPMHIYKFLLFFWYFYFLPNRKLVDSSRHIRNNSLLLFHFSISHLVLGKMVQDKKFDADIEMGAENPTDSDTMDIEKIEKESPHLICRCENEAKKMKEIAKEASRSLQELATTEIGYTLHQTKNQEFSLYFKKVANSDIGKIHFQIHDPSKFEKLITRIWDVNGSKLIDPHFIEGKIVRVYNSNTLLVHQCYKGTFGVEGRYFYVLVNKERVDENTYVIACVSINVNDNCQIGESASANFYWDPTIPIIDAGKHKKDHFFHNPLVASANTCSIEINPDAFTLDTSMKKMFVNLSGYLITKNDIKIDVFYVSSVQLSLSSLIPNFILKKIKSNKMLLIQGLKNGL